MRVKAEVEVFVFQNMGGIEHIQKIQERTKCRRGKKKKKEATKAGCRNEAKASTMWGAFVTTHRWA